MSDPNILISVIVCTYNGSARIPMVLDALAKQQGLAKSDWELLVVDNASTDKTGELVQEQCDRLGLPLRLLHEPVSGLTSAQRRAAREARGKYFSTVDDDNILEPDYLAKAIEFLDSHERAGVIGGRIIALPEGGVIPDDIKGEIGMLAIVDLGSEPRKGVNPPGAGMTGRMFLFKGVLLEIGTVLGARKGDRLTGGNDHELVQMIKHLGWDTWYVPALQLQHYLPIRRLSRDYIDRLYIGSAECYPWLKLLKDPNPNLTRFGLWLANTKLRLQIIKYAILSLLPASLDARLKKAPHWKKFYESQSEGVGGLLSDYEAVMKILGRLNSSAHMKYPQAPKGS